MRRGKLLKFKMEEGTEEYETDIFLPHRMIIKLLQGYFIFNVKSLTKISLKNICSNVCHFPLLFIQGLIKHHSAKAIKLFS